MRQGAGSESGQVGIREAVGPASGGWRWVGAVWDLPA